MRAVIQKVSKASISIKAREIDLLDPKQRESLESSHGLLANLPEDADIEVASIGSGFMVLLGVAKNDTPADAEYICQKIAGLRVFEDADDKLNLSIKDTGGEILAISQFTLMGDARKGRRPSFSDAAGGELGRALYELVANHLAKEESIPVKVGVFGAHMAVSLVNDGPVTILLDSKKVF